MPEHDGATMYAQEGRWTLLVPMRPVAGAKRRLLGALGDHHDLDAHVRLVRAMRADTIAAARQARGVARVVPVLDLPDEEYPEALVTGGGLNEALRKAATAAAVRWPDEGVAAIMSDLPCLNPDDLEFVLATAMSFPSAFVADHHRDGTTMLTVRPGTEMVPSFGEGSALRHVRYAFWLESRPSVRLDVDTAYDLAAARELGVGRETSSLLAVIGGATTARVTLDGSAASRSGAVPAVRGPRGST